LTFVLTATISSLNKPYSWAFAALAWDSTAIWSYFSRLTPYFSATFSDVWPIGIRQFLAASCSKTSSTSFSGSTDFYISNILMFSTPAPIPMSITPLKIFEATIEHASSPELQSLLIDTIAVVSGKPAKKALYLWGISPAPDYKLLPTTMSWTYLGSNFVLSNNPLKTGTNKPLGGVSFKPPLLALVSGVLTAAQITTSSGDFFKLLHWLGVSY